MEVIELLEAQQLIVYMVPPRTTMPTCVHRSRVCLEGPLEAFLSPPLRTHPHQPLVCENKGADTLYGISLVFWSLQSSRLLLQKLRASLKELIASFKHCKAYLN